MRSLVEAAKRSGVSVTYEGADGTFTAVPEETVRLILSALGSSEPAGGENLHTQLTSDASCHLPDFLENRRAWGISLQLYELRSNRNCGIGDFADLAEFCRIAGGFGADFVGCNPLHALFIADPRRCSPFFPSNRRFLNPLYIALDWVAEVDWTLEQAALADRLRRLDLVDYEAVGKLKMALLREAWRRWNGLPDSSRDDFTAFRAQGGEGLRRHAIFETLSGHFAESGCGAGWRRWPMSYQDCRSPQVEAYARENGDEVTFHMWLQWLADAQLREVSALARGAGMRIGLYLDLAVAEAPDGSATWSAPDKFLPGMKIGAPPDMFSAGGQDWGLAPLSPSQASSDKGYFDALLGDAMKCAGALRIDHAMAIRRLFVIPERLPARTGAYLLYPMEQILALIIENSQRTGTIVVGEDLGNVPEGFRAALQEAGILSYRVLCFEHKAGEFAAPDCYPRLSLACVTTHDLPPLRAWLSASDISLRRSHGLIGEKAAAEQHEERRVLQASLVRALLKEGVLTEAPQGSDDEEIAWQVMACAVHRFIARTPSLLVAVRLADMTGEIMPTNIPGTAESYPNWRQKSSVSLDAFTEAGVTAAIVKIMAEERPR